ncbi:secreted protein [Desulfitobacterium sp. LBE]|uniref:FAD-dependent oxidoreductase n=1 Tax=Desulfitobacterium sp. LBE TaxID=884086 RepID=UPI00119BD011|nr:FAD-dependent oxidoreductase [Desulfitobacterium sp. LBE]TWH57235.1 secreted protein [Desulfitobacterium sp. LBE]
MKGNELNRRNFLKGAAGVVSAAAVGVLAGCSSQTAAKGTYTPGTYSATAEGISTIKVTMTFDAERITDVQLDVSGETKDIGQAAGETLKQKLLEAQSAEIDVVSGASVTSQGVMKAAAACIAQAKGESVILPDNAASANTNSDSPTWLGAEPNISDSDCVSIIDTEVLVVGCGTGGLFACCSAAENGAKTLVIEKNSAGGGVRDDLGALNSRYQQDLGTKIDKFAYITEMTKTAAGRVDQRLIRTFCEESGETINWYGDRLAERNVQLWHEGGEGHAERYPYFATGHSPRWTGSNDGKGQELNGNTVLCDYAVSLGVEFKYETKMQKLIIDKGRVVGVYATDAKDQPIRINAGKGVIVCTGGYGRNYEMLEALQPENLALLGRNEAIPGTTGDGIRACLWAGAKFDDTHSMMAFDRCALKPDVVPGLEQAKSGESGFFWMGSQPWLKVNAHGERFFNESGTYDGILHADEFQKDRSHYTIFDSDWTAHIQSFATHGCSRMFPFENGADPNIPFQAMEHEMLPGLVEQGFVIKADTLEELAKGLHLPADKLVKTVERYNQLYELGEDQDFGKEASRLSPVRKAPFYGAKNCGFILCTMDGIQINTNMNAVGKDGNPIEGLYVVGNDSGAYFAYSYPNLSTGAACGRTVTFGRRAGRIAAGK